MQTNSLWANFRPSTDNLFSCKVTHYVLGLYCLYIEAIFVRKMLFYDVAYRSNWSRVWTHNVTMQMSSVLQLG